MSGLDVSHVTMRFGGNTVLTDVSWTIEEGSFSALIGPNGAGKTTLFNCITGFCRPVAGSVLFGDRELVRMPAHDIARLGVVRTFQNLALLGSMTVLENVAIGTYMAGRTGLIAGAFSTRTARRESKDSAQVAEDTVERLGLTAYANSPVAELPYGLRKLVEVARGLASKPKVLLLDEPMAGLTASEKAILAERLRETWREFDITMVIVEHDVPTVMRLAQRVAVLDFGHKIADGPTDEVARDPLVIKAYLGEEFALPALDDDAELV